MNEKFYQLVLNGKMTWEQLQDLLVKFNTAMANCQGEIKSIGENAKGGGANRTWKYADWPTIRDATRPILLKHGLSCPVWHEKREDGIYILAEIKHSSGYEELRECPMVFAAPENEFKPEHIVCGAITYYKRYVYNGLFCIATDEEDSEKPNKDDSPQNNTQSIVKDNLSELPPCPKCGNNLTLRKPKDGTPFYGCTGYPNCRFTLPYKG